MLSIPMWMLYEIGLLFSRYFVTAEEDESTTELASTSDSTSEQP